MPTRNISLTAEQDAFLQEVVEAGEYQNASEAIRDALRVLQQRRKEDSLSPGRRTAAANSTSSPRAPPHVITTPLHARRSADTAKVRRPVHVLYYRVIQKGVIEIVRVLHEKMDPIRHVDERRTQSGI